MRAIALVALTVLLSANALAKTDVERHSALRVEERNYLTQPPQLNMCEYAALSGMRLTPFVEYTFCKREWRDEDFFPEPTPKSGDP